MTEARSRTPWNERIPWIVPRNYLQAISVADHTKEVGGWIIRPQHRRAVIPRERFQFRQIPARFPEEEIKVEGRHERAAECCRGVANQNGFEFDRL
jgi:hypothetical protein